MCCPLNVSFYQLTQTAGILETTCQSAINTFYMQNICKISIPLDLLQAASRYVSVAAAAAAATPSAALSQLDLPQAPLSFADRAGVWDSQGRIQLKNLTYGELEEWCEFIGVSENHSSLLHGCARKQEIQSAFTLAGSSPAAVLSSRLVVMHSCLLLVNSKPTWSSDVNVSYTPQPTAHT